MSQHYMGAGAEDSLVAHHKAWK